MAKKKFRLTEEEKEIERSIAAGEWKKIPAGKLPEVVEAAKKMTKEARINIRMTEDDLEKLRAIAEREGIGYQTLISSTLHKYVNGHIVNDSELDARVRRIVRDELKRGA